MGEARGADNTGEPVDELHRNSEEYGFLISICGICGIIFTIFLLMLFGVTQSSDIVAVIGIITSFVGTILGVFFGQRAGSSGQERVGKVLDATVQASEQKDQIINRIQDSRGAAGEQFRWMRKMAEDNLHQLEVLKSLLPSRPGAEGFTADSGFDPSEIAGRIDEMKAKNQLFFDMVSGRS